MRTAFTFLVAVFFVAAVCLVSLVDGFVRTAADPDAVVAVVDRAGARRAIVGVAEDLLYQHVSADPRVGAVSRLQVRGVIESVLTADWFAANLRRCHRALAAAVATAPASGVLELRALRGELRRAIGELRGRAQAACVPIAGEAQCAPDRPAGRELEAQAQQALASVSRLADKVDLAALVTRDPAEQRTVRRWLARAPQLRWASAVTLATLFGLIVLINVVPFRRLLASAGIVLLVASAVAIGTHALAADRGRAELERRIPAAVESGDPLLARRVSPAVIGLATALVDATVTAARGRLVLGGLAGVTLIVAAVAIGGRRG